MGNSKSKNIGDIDKLINENVTIVEIKKMINELIESERWLKKYLYYTEEDIKNIYNLFRYNKEYEDINDICKIFYSFYYGKKKEYDKMLEVLEYLGEKNNELGLILLVRYYEKLISKCKDIKGKKILENKLEEILTKASYLGNEQAIHKKIISLYSKRRYNELTEYLYLASKYNIRIGNLKIPNMCCCEICSVCNKEIIILAKYVSDNLTKKILDLEKENEELRRSL